MNKNLLTSYLMPLAALVAALGVSTLHGQPIAAGATETSNLTIIDAKQEKLSYMLVSVEQDGVAALNSRSIIGFNIPASEDIETINRLTIQVKYYTYPWFDIFRVFPQKNDRTSIISATTLYTLAITNVIGPPLALPNIPVIGNPDMIDQRAVTYSKYDKDNVEKTKFYQKDWYVILPYNFSYEEIFISIDAYTTGGDHISDGTDDGGFYEDEFGKYIDFGTSSALIHFTSTSEVSRIVISNYGGIGTLYVKFGDYDYQKEVLTDLRGSYAFTGSMNFNLTINIPARYEAQVTTSVLPAFGNVRIYYDASTPAVSYNLIDEDGFPPDPVNDPVNPNWWDRLDPDGILKQILKTITDVVKIALWVGLALALYNWVLIPTIKLFERRKRR